MGLPAQVLQQEEEANRLMGNPEPEDTEAEEDELDPESEEEDIEEPAPQEEVEETKEPEKDSAYWEQRFKVMEGKFKSEVPRLSEQIRDLTSQNTRLTELIASMEQNQPKADGNYLTEEELEKFAEEGFEKSTIDLIGNMAERIAEKRLSKYDQKFDKLTNDVATSSKDRFFAGLERKVPDWRVVNEDNVFIEWLSNQDGYSENTRQQSLNKAYSDLDVDRVARFFNDYRAPAVQSTNNLVKQVAPGKGAASAPPVSQKRIWSKSEITKFYSDQIKGKYSEKEVKKLEKDIFLAQKEGRITQ